MSIGDAKMSKLPKGLASVGSAALAAAMLAVPGLASATGIKIYSYAVKFVCEQEETTEIDTNVNIHNPSLTQTATVHAKIVVPGGGYYFFLSDHLYPDRAESIECDFFQELSGPTIDITDFEGFIVVLSNKPLDVVGLYEVENETETEDVDVERVPAVTQTVPLTLWDNLGNN
jgi:hypothetical protein